MNYYCLNHIFSKIQHIRSFKLSSNHSSILYIPIVFYLSLLGLTRLSTISLRSVVQADIKRYTKNIHISNEAGLEMAEPYYTLESIFYKVDSDNDGYLNTEEVSSWINIKTKEHIHNAILENYRLFTAIDVHPKNGKISWEEYHSHFMQNKGFSRHYIMNHNEMHKDLSRSIREDIMRDKASWRETAKSDPNHLTIDEFLAFKHPESSQAIMLSMVEELFEKFDQDGDQILTEDEFSLLDKGSGFKNAEFDDQGEMNRRREFRDLIDQNKDGTATRKELMFYIDPKNPRHAKEEAQTLVLMADMDRDKKLSLSEVYNKMDLFLGSKMYDIAKSIHEEF